MKKLLLMLVIVGNLFMLAGKTVTKDYIRAGENAAKFSVENTLQPRLIYGGDESYERSGVQVIGWRDIPDTNIASHVIKGDIPEIRERLVSVPMHNVVISSVTQAELLYGLAKRSYPKGLSVRIHEFLIRVDILPWNHDVATVYGDLRARCEAAGITLSLFDMMIAAHAKCRQRSSRHTRQSVQPYT